MSVFKNLVRFTDGAQTYYGDLIEVNGTNYTIRMLEGSDFTDLRETDEIFNVNSVLMTLSRNKENSSLIPYSFYVRLKAHRSSSASG